LSSVRGSLAIALCALLTGATTGHASFGATTAATGTAFGSVATAPDSNSVRRPTPAPNVVEGTVTTTDGRPIPGASIHVSGAAGAAGGEIIKATTDRTGRYRVTVPPGDYAVDGFVDVEHSGRTYRELWLDRVNATCERATSTQGIARDFVLRLSGAKKCIGNPDAADPASYNGAYVTALSSAFPPDALITVSLTPLGPLADGTTGGILTFARSGAALRTNSGPIDQTAVLHDIPLGRYRVPSA
jgi:hypothetical protein